jgi:hypothetical protein
MIYGVSGYTDELVARESVRRGLCPVLSFLHSPPRTPPERESADRFSVTG